ncbi:hypothetical protein [Gracilibacillus caseinilyticus]|uniref:hypothetical protein n=1 Tax=Gracilibacillus caseinilyticus TaxID=2932256 RepID=UPI00350F4EAF
MIIALIAVVVAIFNTKNSPPVLSKWVRAIFSLDIANPLSREWASGDHSSNCGRFFII